ncbi:NAD(P)H-hydrate epimerase, partial [Lachnellula subtilissima]
TLSAKNAAALDKDLMSIGAFSIDQLMELAGLSVSQAGCLILSQFSVSILQAEADESWSPADPAITVAMDSSQRDTSGITDTNPRYTIQNRARTISIKSVSPLHVYISTQLTLTHPTQRLTTQLKNLSVPFTEDFPKAIKETDHIIDAIFGFSFSGEVREPFPAVITALQETHLPVTSVDAPSSWNIEDGPPPSGPGASFMPGTLVSLTAPKPLVKFFKGRHFVGGRFVSPDIAQKYDLDLPEYEGIDQIVEVGSSGQKL